MYFLISHNQINNIFLTPNMDPNTSHLGNFLILLARRDLSLLIYLKLSLLVTNLIGFLMLGGLTLTKIFFSPVPIYYISSIILSNKTISKPTSIIHKFCGLWFKAIILQAHMSKGMRGYLYAYA